MTPVYLAASLMRIWRRTLDRLQTAGLRKSHDPLPLNTVLAQPTYAFFFAETVALHCKATRFRPTAPPFVIYLRQRTGTPGNTQ